MSLESKSNLAARSKLLRAVREFFFLRGVTEVDCPIACKSGGMDDNIALYQLESGHFLHSSPEFGMKRLLADGFGDIYQLSHVFRKGEKGARHNPEFTLLEWYRVNWAIDALIQECADVIALFIGQKNLEKISYRELFLHHYGLDPLTASEKELKKCLKKPYEGLSSRDEILNMALADIEHTLGSGVLTVLYDYPASQCALAQVDGLVAKRFEIYWQGTELANGYLELCDSVEQKRRFLACSKPYPIDECLCEAVGRMPPCVGVAMGFDRLCMLAVNAQTIAEVLFFDWETA